MSTVSGSPNVVKECPSGPSPTSIRPSDAPYHITLDPPPFIPSPNELLAIITAYVTRTSIEELQLVSEEVVLQHLQVNPKLGLSNAVLTTCDGVTKEVLLNEDVERRRELFGKNEMPKKQVTPLWKLIYSASDDPMLRLLMGASIVSLIVGMAFGDHKKTEWIESVAIMVSVTIVIMVTALNDYYKEKQFAALYDCEEKTCVVIRAGEQTSVNTSELVVGDLIQLTPGDEIPVDCYLIQASDITVDESSLTGESDHIKKANYDDCFKKALAVYNVKDLSVVPSLLNTDAVEANTGEMSSGHHQVPSPICLSGSTVMTGTGTAVVVGVGLNSQIGKLFSKLAVDTECTPLQNKLNALAQDIGYFGMVSALVVLVALLVQYGIEQYQKKNDPEEIPDVGSQIATAVIGHIVTAITIVVVAVPEGLPLAVTISLAFSVSRMLETKNYVRRLAACETMGSADVICSDKTGTLTKNQMEVEAFWNGSVFHDTIQVGQQITPGEYGMVLAHNICVNSTAHLEITTNLGADGVTRSAVQQIGNPTECALLQFINNMGADSVAIRQIFMGLRVGDQLVLQGPDQRHTQVGSHYGSPDRYGSPHMAGSGRSMDYSPSVHSYHSGGVGGEPPSAENIVLFDLPLYYNDDGLILAKVPFSSEKKAMTTFVKHPSDPNKIRLFIKGASEVVLRRCVARIDSSGNPKMVPADKIAKIEGSVIKGMTLNGLRTIAIAFRDFELSRNPDYAVKVDPSNPSFLFIERELTVLGIAGVRDPVREEVPHAVALCNKAGISVKMCTGDNIETAKQIGKRAGIYKPEFGGLAITGPEFMRMVGGVVCSVCKTETCPCQNPPPGVNANSITPRTDVLLRQVDFERIAPKLEIMARSQPADKYALVTGLKTMGSVVAVTGDGTNDAPALKKADVGFAMGITGKEVAKQAADIVLLDDNFSSIVSAVKWGRNIYDNIQRFLQFQLTVNCVAVIVAFIGAVTVRQSPLSAVQLLWVNLIMDTFAALALATELPTDELLDRKPHSRSDYLIGPSMMRNILAQAVYQVTVLLTMLYSGQCWIPETSYPYTPYVDPTHPLLEFSIFEQTCGNGSTVALGHSVLPFSSTAIYPSGWVQNITAPRHYTMIFNTFVMMQVFNLLNARVLNDDLNIFRNVVTNHYWIVIMLLIVSGQILIVEFGGKALAVHAYGLTWQQWLICVAFGFGCWIVAALVKLAPRSLTRTLPTAGTREINPLTEKASFALVSRGRIPQRLTSRMNIGAAENSNLRQNINIRESQAMLRNSRLSKGGA